jgi:hypothetical protein
MAYEKSCFFSLVHRTFTSLQRSAEPIAANRVLSDLRPISRPQSNSVRFPVVHEPLKNSPIGRNEHHPRALRPGEPPSKLGIGQDSGIIANVAYNISADKPPLHLLTHVPLPNPAGVANLRVPPPRVVLSRPWFDTGSCGSWLGLPPRVVKFFPNLPRHLDKSP